MVESWNLVRLGDVADVLVGYPFKSQYFNENNKGIRLLRGKNVTHRGLRWGSDTRWWESITPDVERYLLSENDIVIGMDGSLVGKNYALISNSDLPLLLVQRVACIRAKTGVDQKYLWFVIASEKFERYIDSIRTGTSIPHVSSKQILDYTISLPPLPVQKKIAAILSSLDDKIEINTRMNKVLEETARALFHRWFVEFEFLNDEGKPYKSSGGRMIASEMGEIPEGWRVMSFYDILTPRVEKSSDPTIPEYSVTNGGIQPRNEKFKKKLSASTSKNKIIRRYDLVFGMSREILNWGLMKEEIGGVSSAYNVFSVGKHVNPFYLESFISHHPSYFKDIIKPAAREGQGIDKPALFTKHLYIPSPELLEQFYRIEESITRMQEDLENEIDQLVQIRDSLLPKLMDCTLAVDPTSSKNDIYEID